MIIGAVIGNGSSQIKIAIGCPISFSEIRQKISFHVSSKFIITTGSHVGDVAIFAYLKNAAFSICFVCGSIAEIRIGLSLTNTSSNEYKTSVFIEFCNVGKLVAFTPLTFVIIYNG
ncbi:hypothetical protein GW750_06265 [bacterium]|nr:hypothetical protein [bacterium]